MGRSATPDASDPRPLLSVDIDGVLAHPPFGLGAAMNRDVSLQPCATPGARANMPRRRPSDQLLQFIYYRIRYAGRPLMPGASEALAAAQAAGYRLIALTGRDWRGRRATERWLGKHGLLEYFIDDGVGPLAGIRMNDSGRSGRRLPAARFKERVCAELGVVRHIDDDPATAALLARNGVIVDLIDWPRSRGLDFPPGVTRRADLRAFAEALAGAGADAHASDASPPPPADD